MNILKITIISLLLFTMINIVYAFDIVKKGKPNAVVVLSAEATDGEKYAANEFINYIEKISGVKLDIVNRKQKGNNVFIGIKPKSKDDDGINLSLIGTSLYIQGNGQRGTIYSVYEFLERACGVKFYTRDIEVVPKSDTVSTPKKLKYSYTPILLSRDTDFLNSDGFPSFYVKQRFNSSWKLRGGYGGSLNLINGVHSIDRLMPKNKYFNEHPEYFAFVNGARMAGARSQLCFTNKEMQKVLAENVLESIRKSTNRFCVDVSQNDNNAFCECENCQAAYEKYGAKSGALIECINYVAKEVKKEFPGMLVETLAYAGTVRPPKNIELEDNILIRLCNIECNFSDPIENRGKFAPYKRVWGRALTGLNTDKINDEFATYMEDWAKLTDYIFVWDYNANFSNYHIAHPNFQVLQPNVQFFVKNHAKAVFCEGDRSNENATFNELKTYLISKILWDPNVDTEKCKGEFCDLVYGKGADDIIEIIDIMTHAITDKPMYLPTYVYDMEWMTNDDFVKSVKLFQHALEVTKDTKDTTPDYTTFENKRYDKEADFIDLPPNPYNKIYQMYIDFLYGVYLKSEKDYIAIRDLCNLPWEDQYEYEKHFTEYNEAHGNLCINEGGYITPRGKVIELEKADTPDICKEVADEDWFEINCAAFDFTDKLPKKIEDPQASKGIGVKLEPNNQEWSMMLKLDGNITQFKKNDKTKIDIYLVAKTINKKNDKGNIITVGVYDMNVNKQRFDKKVKVSDLCDEEYRTVFVGTMDLRPCKGGNFYLSPCKNPDCADNIVIDRLIGIVY